MQHPESIPPPLAQWVQEVLGPGSLNYYRGNVLAAVAIAEPRSRGRAELHASNEALEAWSAVLRGSERALVQAKSAFVKAARASGWDDSRLAEGMGVPPEALARALNDVEEDLIRTHPGMSGLGPPR